MNNIRTEINNEDHQDGRGKCSRELAMEALASLKVGCPYTTTFIQLIPMKDRKAVEDELKKAFELWANSWIAPPLRQIVAKHTKTK